MFDRIRTVFIAAIASAMVLPAAASDATGAGASFVYPAMTRWSADYRQATGKEINYQSIGSGGGIAQIRAGTVDFGSSDAPLPPEELEKAGLVQFPSVIGGVVPIINLEGVPAGAMKLDGETLARIFLGRITHWNDPAIVALNGDLQLPASRITVVHRSDGSGTTFNFTNYLSKVSRDWKQAVGEGTSVKWPTGIGGKGNEGVAAYVRQIRGSIGYVELSYATQNRLAWSRLKNAAGNFVQPTEPGENAWPITATNFILMRKKPRNVEGARNAREFFRWVYANGDRQARELGYVPLPDPLVRQIEAYWAERLPY